MKAACIHTLGGPEEIRYVELADPVPSPRQVLVRVEAVAVNSVDTYLRSGRWRTEVNFPLAVGRDLVGRVAAVGSAVEGFEVGERAWTNSAGYGGRPGATAELVAVDQDRLYPLPSGADAVSFVASVHPGATAHGALVGRARVQPGECVTVVGANGAVGMCMVQLAAAQGAEVVAVIRDVRAGDRLSELGASEVVIADADHAAGAPWSGVDVFIDTSGQADIAAAVGQLNPRGRVVLIAGRRRQQFDLWELYVREIQLLGFVMSAMTVDELAGAADWINARPPAVSVGRVLGFDGAAEAHATLEAGGLPRMADGTVGRLVLAP